MTKRLSFEARKRLEAGDYGEQVEPGFFMADLGRADAAPGPVVQADPVQRTKPKTRQERIALADSLADRLMQEYMKPEAMNDPNVLNPIRDGIPQCSKHPFVSGDSTKFGCIHGCGNREREGSAGVLPVSKEHTVGDVWVWVTHLVRLAVERGDHRAGFVR